MVKGRINKDLDTYGVLMTMYDSRTSLSNQVVEEVQNYFGAVSYTHLRVYEVFHKFADDHEREVTALFLHGAMDGVGHIFQVRTYIRLFDYDDARCGQHVVVHRDSRRVCRLRPLRRPR